MNRTKNDNTVARFFDLLAALLEEGIPLLEGLDLARNEFSGANMREAIGDIKDRVLEGEMLSNTIKDYPGLFPESVSGILGFFEQKGGLDIALSYLGKPGKWERIGSEDSKDSLVLVFELLALMMESSSSDEFSEAFETACSCIGGGDLKLQLLALREASAKDASVEGTWGPVPTLLRYALSTGRVAKFTSRIAEGIEIGCITFPIVEQDQELIKGLRRFTWFLAMYLELGMSFDQDLVSYAEFEPHEALRRCAEEMGAVDPFTGDHADVMDNYPEIFSPACLAVFRRACAAGNVEKSLRRIARGMTRGLFQPPLELDQSATGRL